MNDSTLETLNKVVRYLHFDPRATKRIHTVATLSQDTGIPYPTLQKVMVNKVFESLFMRDQLGGIILSNVTPDFLIEKIDLDTPYTPVYTCNDPSHTHNMNDKPASPQNQKPVKSTPTKFNTDWYDREALNSILHGAKWNELIALGQVEPYKAPVSGNKTHIFNQYRNAANVILRTLDLLSAKDPAEKAKEILTDPIEFPILQRILQARQTDHVADTPEEITAPVGNYVPQPNIPSDIATVMCPRMRKYYTTLAMGRKPMREEDPNKRTISDLCEFLRAPQEETIKPGCPAVVWRDQQYDKEEIAFCLEQLKDVSAPNSLTIGKDRNVDFEMLKIELQDALNGGTFI
jgi:hypothetical protein